MKANPAGLILWILGATGAFLLYCAVKGYTPQSVLAAFVNRKTAPVPFGHTTTSQPGGSTGGGTSGGGGGGGGGGGI